MSKEIKLTKELIQKAKGAKSVEELKAIAKENDVELGDERAAELFSNLSVSGELADDELMAVAGGGCNKALEGVSCPYCESQTVESTTNAFYDGNSDWRTCTTCNKYWRE